MNCRWLIPLVFSAASVCAEIDPLRFEKEIIVGQCADPMQLDIAADGRVFFVERGGAVKMWHPETRQTATLGKFPALTTGDAGALGLALARDFAQSGQLYLFRIPQDGPAKIVISRHTAKGAALDAAQEKVILEIPLGQGKTQSHCGGGLAWDAAGNLLIGVGDNMPPQDLPAVHPEDTSRDARGTAGNSMELRGKVLRITPKADGSYGIPAGNLFGEGQLPGDQGRPEIYAMGVRNPFRVAADPERGWITWGDVGGNVKTQLNLGPEGFDEINVTSAPGFFGWPYCSGPNAPWRSFDPKTQAPAGDFFDPLKLTNDSRVNTGLKELPPSRPAAFYYTSTASHEWPFVGSGGRSITGGVFYYPGSGAGELRLPNELKGQLIFGEWMRNWLAAAEFDAGGKLVKAGAIAGHLRFRRPADYKIGPDGTLFVAECGDRWSGNTDSQITRVVYRRGNRPPVAKVSAPVTAGPLPLKVKLSAAGSSDPDGDKALTFSWNLGDGRKQEGAEVEAVFEKEGVWNVALTVTDSAGMKAVAAQSVVAGNAAPVVAFTAPQDGGFFEWGKPLPWALKVSDAEDGAVPPEMILTQMERRNRAADNDAAAAHPGLTLMRQTTCFACHNATDKSAGPPYAAVAAKYAGDESAPAKLAAKIIEGGAGVWGELPMPPHPQHTEEEAALMVSWILTLSAREVSTLSPGLSGKLELKQPARQWGQADNSVLALTASATDRGGVSTPPQRGTAEIILRSRRQRAAFFDRGQKAQPQDNLEQGGLVARVAQGGWIAFDRIRLTDAAGVKLHCWPQSGEVKVSIYAGSLESPALAEAVLPAGPHSGKPQEVMLSWKSAPPQEPGSVYIRVDGAAGALLDVMWVDFPAESK